MSASVCKGCGKQAVFAKDDAGKWQILDPAPPVYLVNEDDGTCRRDMKAMVSHFITCPKANTFSRSKHENQKGDPNEKAG